MQADDDNNPFYTGEEKLLPPANPAPPPRISGQYGTSSPAPDPAPAELQFQSFAHTSVNIPSDGRNSIRAAPATSSPMNVVGNSGIHADPQSEFAEDPTSPMAPPSQSPAGAHFWTISYYKHLFDVDTTQVLQRVLRSMLPFKFSFIEYASRNPDFYGPFWIATTLIFMMAISGNLAEVFGSSGAEYDFNKIPIGACVIYGYSIVVPLVMWVVFKWIKIPFKLMELLCIYGYALFVFIPACVLCIIPQKQLQWVFTAVATALSGWFLVTNLIPPLKQQEARIGYITLAVVGVLHLGLALSFKLYFFHSSA